MLHYTTLHYTTPHCSRLHYSSLPPIQPFGLRTHVAAGAVAHVTPVELVVLYEKNVAVVDLGHLLLLNLLLIIIIIIIFFFFFFFFF